RLNLHPRIPFISNWIATWTGFAGCTKPVWTGTMRGAWKKIRYPLEWDRTKNRIGISESIDVELWQCRTATLHFHPTANCKPNKTFALTTRFCRLIWLTAQSVPSEQGL